jgi:hypothetical protein
MSLLPVIGNIWILQFFLYFCGMTWMMYISLSLPQLWISAFIKFISLWIISSSYICYLFSNDPSQLGKLSPLYPEPWVTEGSVISIYWSMCVLDYIVVHMQKF